MAVYDALEALRRPVLRPLQRWLDPWGLGERSVFVGATGGHFASTVSVERLRRLNPSLAHRLHSVSFLQPLQGLVAELNSLAPTTIATYPSAAVLLAEERLAGRLEIAPQAMWTGGETLSPAMRAFVQQAFFCRARTADLQRARPTIFCAVPRLWVKFQQGVHHKLPTGSSISCCRSRSAAPG